MNSWQGKASLSLAMIFILLALIHTVCISSVRICIDYLEVSFDCSADGFRGSWSTIGTRSIWKIRRHRDEERSMELSSRFPVMSRIRARISPNFADGFFTTPLHGHLSDRGGGAAATISAPIMGCWGLPETLFWGHKAWSLDYTKGWNKGSHWPGLSLDLWFTRHYGGFTLPI